MILMDLMGRKTKIQTPSDALKSRLIYLLKFNYSHSITSWIEVYASAKYLHKSLLFLSVFQLIISNAFEESAQKAARSPSRRGKYLNLIVTPDVSSNFLSTSRTVVLFPPPIFRYLKSYLFLI